MDEDNLVIPGGTDQELSVPFASDVRASAAAQTVNVDSGADVSIQGDDSDGVDLPGAISEYSVSASGNQITLERGDGTAATVSLNGAVDIGFDGGTATAQLDTSGDVPAVTLGGTTVDGGVDPGAVTLADTAVGEADGQTGGDAENDVILNGQDQTVEVPFNAEVTGTAAAETVQVPGNADVQFAGDDNDRVEFGGNIGDFQVEQAGNRIVLSQGDNSVSVSLNGEVDMAFGDGSTSADLDTSGDVPQATLGGQAVGDSFDPTQLDIDPDDVADIPVPGDGTGDDGSDGDDGGDATLPDLPGNGGAEVVSSGTAGSDNIDGNQSATVSGDAGADRFIFDTGSSADLTIDDFSSDDQLFFEGIDLPGDIGLSNDDLTDGEVGLSAGQVAITITNLSDPQDGAIFNPTTFEAAFGGDAVAIA